MDSVKTKKIALAMSGGIDSAVSAYLLQENGYEVIGVHFDLWKWEQHDQAILRSKQILSEIKKTLNITLISKDYKEYFKDIVIQDFIDQQKKGFTPNPCVMCNPLVKFNLLKQFADEEGISYISTGHYARVSFDEKSKKYLLKKGIDNSKDQSYMLCYLNQDFLSRIVFPLGNAYKKEIFKIGNSLGLNIEDSAESQDLCFVKPENYKYFLNESVGSQLKGNIVTSSGDILGKHEGLVYYTIGQRKGIKVSASRPYYVLRKNLDKNELVVGFAEELDALVFNVVDINWIAEKPKYPYLSDVKIRYQTSQIPCEVRSIDGNKLAVELKEPMRGITPGQYAVFYSDDIVLGGGKIIR